MVCAPLLHVRFPKSICQSVTYTHTHTYAHKESGHVVIVQVAREGHQQKLRVVEQTREQRHTYNTTARIHTITHIHN